MKNFKTQAKKLIILRTEQSEIETKHLFRRVKELGLVTEEVTFDLILGLNLDNLMERRLQTLVYKKGLARTIKQARQFIVHEHILVDGKKITSPSYLVSLKEQSTIEFSAKSSLFSEEHPERAIPEKEEIKPKKEIKKDKELEELESIEKEVGEKI